MWAYYIQSQKSIQQKLILNLKESTDTRIEYLTEEKQSESDKDEKEKIEKQLESLRNKPPSEFEKFSKIIIGAPDPLIRMQ